MALYAAGAVVAAGLVAGVAGTLPAAAAGPTGHSLRLVPRMSTGQSPPLRLLHASPKARGVRGADADTEQPIRHGRVLSGPTDPASVQTQAGTTAAVSATASFEGQGNADGVVPPDTNGDVGPHNYVQWVNLHLDVFDRSGTQLMSVPGNQIFAGLGSSNPCSYDNNGDPVVQYDQFHDRWVLTQFAFDDFFGTPIPPFGECVAVSKTSDPTGAYWLYSWDVGAAGNTGTDNFPDYPKLGIWSDGCYMSFNYFSSDLSTFLGSGIMIMESSRMLTGDPGARAFATGPMGTKYGGLLPPDIDGPSTPPAGTPATYAAFDTEQSTDTLQFWHAHVDWTAGTASFGSANWAPDATVTVPAYDWNLCSGSRDCIPQPGTSQKLDPLSDRLMYRAAYRYFPSDGHESMVLTHTVDTDPSAGLRAGLRWYEIRNVSATPSRTRPGPTRRVQTTAGCRASR
jgi:hypothetical protein